MIDNRSWDDALTGLRGLAASWVLLFHLFGVVGPRALFVPGTSIELHWLLTSGGAGVWVLYTLCGYLLAGPFVTRENSRQVPHIRRYLLRRLWRILPPLWVQILVLSIVAGWADGQMLIRLKEMLPYALLVQNLVVPLSAPAANAVWWTLPVEFDFYLLLPLLFAIVGPHLARRPRMAAMWILLIAVAVEIAWRQHWLKVIDPQRVADLVAVAGQLPGVLSCFAIGIATRLHQATAARGDSRGIAANGLFLLGIVIAVAAIVAAHLTAATYWRGSLMYYLLQPAVATGCALIILACERGGAMARALLANPISRWLGLISYSLYLWHLPIFDWLAPASRVTPLQGTELWTYIALAMTATLLVASASYLLVERPALAMMGRYRARKSNQASTAG